MKKKVNKIYLQAKRRFRKKIVGTDLCPRLSVFRSHKHIYAQLIDDKNKQTIASFSTLSKGNKIEKSATKEAAFSVGMNLAKKALAKEISAVVFDRGKKPYLGRIQSLAEGCREIGLLF